VETYCVGVQTRLHQTACLNNTCSYWSVESAAAFVYIRTGRCARVEGLNQSRDSVVGLKKRTLIAESVHLWPKGKPAIGVARRGLGCLAPKFLESIVICALRGGIANKIVLSPKIKHFAPPKIFGWLRQWRQRYACNRVHLPASPQLSDRVNTQANVELGVKILQSFLLLPAAKPIKLLLLAYGNALILLRFLIL